MTKRVAGIDVGKQELAVSVARGPVRRFPNTGVGLTAVLAWIREQAVTHVVCEATGGYERVVVQRVRVTDLAMSVAHPTKVRAFARAVGQGAKTDPLDAQILAHYGEVFELPVEAAQEEASEEVRALLGRRQQLLDQRTQELNRLEKGLRGRVKQSCQRHLAWLDKELKHLEDEYQQAIEARPALAERAALYQSVRGVGVLTSATLLAYVPELGQGSGKALTALVGLVPWAADRWDAPGVSGDSRRPGPGAPGVIHGGVVGDPHGHGPGTVLSAVTAAGEAGQSGLGGRDAEAAVATACDCAAGDAMGG